MCQPSLDIGRVHQGDIAASVCVSPVGRKSEGYVHQRKLALDPSCISDLYLTVAVHIAYESPMSMSVDSEPI